MKRGLILAATALAVAATGATAPIRATMVQDASVFMTESVSGCTNNPGPFITLNGEIRLGGIGARLILTNNEKWTHRTETDISVDVTLLDAGESIQIAKQPPQGGVGGNPHIYLRFNDCAGNPFTDSYTYLGRCVQGLSNTSLNFELPTDVSVDVTAGSCRNNPGPFITLEGELSLGGFCAEVVFTNNARFTHVTSADVSFNVVLIPEGSSITFAKQPPEGGAGGNPYIWVQFLDGAGQDSGSPIFIGRCVQLGRSSGSPALGSGEIDTTRFAPAVPNPQTTLDP